MTHITSKKESKTLLFSVKNCFSRLELQRKYDINNLKFDMIKKLRNQYLIGE